MTLTNKEEEKEEVTFPLFQKVEASLDDVTLKVHRYSDDQLVIQEKLKDLETKVILLIQAAKNAADGKSNSNIFDGIGDVVSAIDYLKDMMKGQYAKLSEFREVEKSVDLLNNFYLDTQQNKVKEIKDKELNNEKLGDLKDSIDHLNNQIVHIEENRFTVFENMLIEKLDYNEFETTINNIREYLDNFSPGESRPSFIKADSSKNIGDGYYEEKKSRRKSQSSVIEEDVEQEDANEGSKTSRPTPINSRKPSRGTSENQSPTLAVKRESDGSPQGTRLSGINSSSTISQQNIAQQNSGLQKKKTMKKAPSFIPKETVRLKEFERKIKEMDDKITNIIKTSKNDIIPIIEKRLLGIREELENKASTLDVKKLLPQVTEAYELSKKAKDEINEIKEKGLLGDKGGKMLDDINLAHSKIAQLDGKFTWLHTSHKDLMKKLHDSMNAAQPLMMNTVDVGSSSGVPDSAVSEIKEEIERHKKELTGINSKIKESVNELKEKLNEKVDDRALNELEDQLTTDIDQTIKSIF